MGYGEACLLEEPSTTPTVPRLVPLRDQSVERTGDVVGEVFLQEVLAGQQDCVVQDGGELSLNADMIAFKIRVLDGLGAVPAARAHRVGAEYRRGPEADILDAIASARWVIGAERTYPLGEPSLLAHRLGG